MSNASSEDEVGSTLDENTVPTQIGVTPEMLEASVHRLWMSGLRDHEVEAKPLIVIWMKNR
jgi:hypothetical protein